MLEVKNLCFSYGKVNVLHDISMQVNQGEIVSIIGPNGAGKTTTLRNISGVLKPNKGEVIYKGENIASMHGWKITKKGIAHSLEGRHVFPYLTVEENIDMGAFTRRDKTGVKADKERMYELFPRLKERRTQDAGTLSGGEQQMLAMARALMLSPELLILDEPSLGLAPIIVEEIFETIKNISKNGITILLVEQNANLALEISDRGYVMELGRLILTDTGANLLNNESVRKSYLGVK